MLFFYFLTDTSIHLHFSTGSPQLTDQDIKFCSTKFKQKETTNFSLCTFKDHFFKRIQESVIAIRLIQSSVAIANQRTQQDKDDN